LPSETPLAGESNRQTLISSNWLVLIRPEVAGFNRPMTLSFEYLYKSNKRPDQNKKQLKLSHFLLFKITFLAIELILKHRRTLKPADAL
jgi:hypothetical protein